MDRQRVLITGGGSGIGLSIAAAFLQAGAAVHICDADSSSLAEARRLHPALTGSRTDVGSARDIELLRQDVADGLGGLDVLVNNAGIGGPTAPVDEISDADWDSVLRVNVTAMFLTVRAFAPLMKRQGSGCILNLSTTSTRTGLPNRTPYVVSKAAVEGLTHNLARELGPFGIRCNAILPGSIENERGRRLMRERAERDGITYEQALQRRLGFISMRTRIDASEIGETAVFLASDAARHVTGQKISVCGNVEWEG